MVIHYIIQKDGIIYLPNKELYYNSLDEVITHYKKEVISEEELELVQGT